MTRGETTVASSLLNMEPFRAPFDIELTALKLRSFVAWSKRRIRTGLATPRALGPDERLIRPAAPQDRTESSEGKLKPKARRDRYCHHAIATDQDAGSSLYRASE
jgi:hypothetical protein